MGEFWKRTVFGFLFAIVVIGGIFLGGMYTAIMLAAVVMLGSTEIANLYTKRDQDNAAIKNIAQSLSIFLFVFLAAFAESPDFPAYYFRTIANAPNWSESPIQKNL